MKHPKKMLLRNKILIFVIFILLASTVAGQVLCEVDNVLECLKKSLYDFLINPDSPNTRPVDEIKDLLTYYITIPTETVTVNCAQDKGAYTNRYISDIMDDIGECIFDIECADGTDYAECSPTKPKYCYAGTIIDNCAICGCPTDNQLCNPVTGQCQSTQETIQCIIDDDCESDIASTPTYITICGSAGGLNYIYYTLIKQICQNPNTPQSYCDSTTIDIITEYCPAGCSNGVCLSPTQITTCQELQNIKNDLTADYALGNDIDCSATTTWNNGQGFEPIGDYTNPFTGTFNGNAHSISNLYINRPSESGVGLFSQLNGASISDIRLENVNIEGWMEVGALAGYISGTVTTVTKVKCSGQVTGTRSIGGLVGLIGRGSISDSFSTCEVTGNRWVGGISGAATYDEPTDISILNTYSTGDVSGTESTGGLVGLAHQSTITNSYSTSNVNGVSEVGGLVGEVLQTSPPESPTQITNSYFTDDDDNGVGIFEPLGQSAFYGSSHAVYSGWDFTNIWQSNPGSYPFLRSPPASSP